MNQILTDSKPAAPGKRAVAAFNQAGKGCSPGPGGKGPGRPEEGTAQAASRASSEVHPPGRAWQQGPGLPGNVLGN